MFTCAALRFKPISAFPERGRCARTRAVGAFIVKNKVEWHLGKWGIQNGILLFETNRNKAARKPRLSSIANYFLRVFIYSWTRRVRFIQSLLVSLLIFRAFYFLQHCPTLGKIRFFWLFWHVSMLTNFHQTLLATTNASSRRVSGMLGRLLDEARCAALQRQLSQSRVFDDSHRRDDERVRAVESTRSTHKVTILRRLGATQSAQRRRKLLYASGRRVRWVARSQKEGDSRGEEERARETFAGDVD